MQILLLRKRDISALSRLAREIITQTPYYSLLAKKIESAKYTNKSLKEKLKDGYQLFIVARQNGRLVAFCHGSVDAGTSWIHWICVSKNYRRKGIAMKLLKSLEKELKKSKIHKIWCDSRINNKESIPLLKKFGLRKVAFLKKHWYGHDFYLWQKFI